MMTIIYVCWGCAIARRGAQVKVSKAQAQANRAQVVATASRLFRERGFDGVGVAELMAEAGFTHGGFYKQFPSKADLMAEAAACGLAASAAESEGRSSAAFLGAYLSRQHRDARPEGCTLAALGGDAARQDPAVRASFAAGIEALVARLAAEGQGGQGPEAGRAQAIATIAQAVGGLMLSRACPDDAPLADEILQACLAQGLAALPPDGGLRPAEAGSGSAGGP